MKRIRSILVCCALALTLCACASGGQSSQAQSELQPIQSQEMVSFDCWFSTLEMEDTGDLGQAVYTFSLKDDNGLFHGEYARSAEDGEQSFHEAFYSDEAGLAQLQALVTEQKLEALNGVSRPGGEGAALKGCRLIVDYESGETLSCTDGEENLLSLEQMEAIRDWFAAAAARRRDFTGQWHRTEVSSPLEATVTINNQTPEGFDFTGRFNFYSHSGEAADTALFQEDGTAVYVNPDPLGEEEETLTFRREGEELMVTPSETYSGFGMNVTAEGVYTREAPHYLNETILNETFTSQEQAALQDLLGENYEEQLVFPVENGAVTRSEVELEGGVQAVYYDCFIPTLATEGFQLLIDQEGEYYFLPSGGALVTTKEGVTDFPYEG